eukprot:1808927-Rhodomonas_salina.2
MVGAASVLISEFNLHLDPTGLYEGGTITPLVVVNSTAKRMPLQLSCPLLPPHRTRVPGYPNRHLRTWVAYPGTVSTGYPGRNSYGFPGYASLPKEARREGFSSKKSHSPGRNSYRVGWVPVVHGQLFAPAVV